MKITKITEQLKNLDRVNVFVDHKYSFSLTLDQLLTLRLRVGDDIDAVKLDEYKQLSLTGKLKLQTIAWLMIRPHSVKEVRDYLKRKKVDSEVGSAWITEFQTKKYLNDEDFAHWLVEQRRYKQHSTIAIKYELRSRGIDEAIIENALADDLSSDRIALMAIIAKKRQLTKYQDTKKLTDYLIRQGYNYLLVKEVLAE